MSLRTFLQDPPALGNQYLEDTCLRDILNVRVPSNLLVDIEHDLVRFGNATATTIKDLGEEAETNLPVLFQYDAWQQRIDDIKCCNAWQKLSVEIPAREGLVAIGYDRKTWAHHARLYQFSKLYMFEGSCAVATCPLAMTYVLAPFFLFIFLYLFSFILIVI